MHCEATEKNIETGNFPPLSGEKTLGREILYKETSLKDESIARIDQDCSGIDSRERTTLKPLVLHEYEGERMSESQCARKFVKPSELSYMAQTFMSIIIREATSSIALVCCRNSLKTMH